MVRVPVSRNRVSPQVARDPGLVVDPAAFAPPIEAAQRFGHAALGLVRDIADIDNPVDRGKVMKRAAAQQKAVSNRVTAEGVREMIALRGNLERNALPGADGFEQMFGRAAEVAIARLAQQGADDQHRNEITQGLRQVGGRIAEDARAFQAFKTVEHRRGAVDELHGAFAETIHRYPQMYDELRLAGVATVLGDEANFDPVEQVGRQKAFEARAATAAVAGMTALNADEAEKDLDSGRYDDVLDEVQKSQLRARIGLAREDRESELDTVRRNALADMDRKTFAFLSDYRRRIEAGAANRVELMDAETAGTITEAQAIKLRTAFDEHAAKREVEQTRIDRVSQILDDGGKLDPSNEDDRHAVDLHCQAVLRPMFPDGPRKDFHDALIDYTEITGIAPETALCPLSGLVLAGDDTAERASAAQTINTIIGLDPEAERCLPSQAIPLAEFFGRMTGLGIDPGIAIEMADAQIKRDPDTATPRGASADGGEAAAKPNGDAAEGNGEDGFAPGDDADEPDFEPGDEPPISAEGEEDDAGEEATGDLDAGGEDDEPEFEPEDEPVPGADDIPDDGLDAIDPEKLERLRRLLREPRFTTGAIRRGADRTAGALDAQGPAPEKLDEITALVLDILPGTGEIRSGIEAGEAFSRLHRAVERGDLDDAFAEGGAALIAGIGAIPGLGALARLPKAAVRLAALARRVARGQGKVRRAVKGEPSIDSLEGKIGPKNRIPLHKRREYNELKRERDQLRNARLAAPAKSMERRQLLSRQRAKQLRMNKIQGAAYENRIENFLLRRGFIVEPGRTVKTRLGMRKFDHKISNTKRTRTADIEYKSGKSPQIRNQKLKDDSLVNDGQADIVIIHEMKQIRGRHP